MLALAAESKPMPAIVPELIERSWIERNATRWTSTQDNAWMLLAARALSANAADMEADSKRRRAHRHLFGAFRGQRLVEAR